MSSCSGKTALVTDAAAGTGRAAAIALAKAGAQVLVHHHRRPARAESVVREIQAVGGRAQAISADMVASEGPHELAKRVREIVGARLDVLVFNTCATKPPALEDTTVEELDSKLASEIRAPFFLIQQLLPILGSSSSIIFTSPPAAPPSPDAVPEFAPSRGAVANLVNHFAPLLNPRGIRVNAIAPVATGAAADEANSPFRNGHRPLFRGIGDAVAFLASNEAIITGETLQIDS